MVGWGHAMGEWGFKIVVSKGEGRLPVFPNWRGRIECMDLLAIGIS